MGTMVGALIVSTLMHVDPALKRLLDELLAGLTGSSRFTAIGGLGLVFCYVSSIPILVFHAARSLLPNQSQGKGSTKLQKLYEALLPSIITFLFYFCPILYVLAALALLHVKKLDLEIAHIVYSAFLVMVLAQCGMILTLLLLRKRSYSYYKKLAAARGRQGDAGELVTSYRHLREHGNSIFIVALEAILGLLLNCAYRTSSNLDHVQTGLLYVPQFYLYGVILALWIGPGVGIWFYATLLENEFVKDTFWP
jgi:hypothetical protein